MPAQAPSLASLIGLEFSHYRIIEEIGSGGMGVVFRAHDQHLDREVAMKVLSPGTITDEAARKHLRKEALALSKLNHPNIATVYDFDTQRGMDFLVMEYIPGITLREKLAAGPLPEKETLRLGIQVAEGLAAAHEHGVVHRDLKPGNLRLTSDGRLKILDFGIAKLRQPLTETASTESSLGTHSISGTLPYMAPEQLSGEEVDTRTDIHGAGFVLYEMATGQRPFAEVQGGQLIGALLRKPPIPPTMLNPGVSAELERIIGKCLEKDPENRYQSAKELAIDLRRLLTPGAVIDRCLAKDPAQRYQHAGEVRAGRQPWLRNAIGAALLIAVAVLGAREWKAWRARTPLGPIQSLAVLPLENLSNDPAQEYFADGMTEALITDLSKIRALRVISRTSAMQYKHAHKPLPEIASELHVDAVVEGSVERSGDRVRIDAQLIQAKEDRNLWANSYERSVSDVLALQSDVAQAIAGEIRVQLTPQEHTGLSARRMVNPQAYEAYLRGLYLWNKRTPADLRSAMEEFKKAIDLDPTYALAYAGLANGYILLVDHGELSPDEAMPLAKAAAKKALGLDDSLAEAYASLAAIAWTYDWDAAAAEAEFRRALALNPSYATGHQWYALYLVHVGRFDEGLDEIRRAQELDPLSLIIELNVGRFYYFARRYDQAIEHLQQLERREPNFWYVHNILGQTYLAMGQLNLSIAELERARALSPESERNIGMLGDAYARAGHKAEALRLVSELTSLSQKRHVSPAYFAMIYMSLGERTLAVAWLEKAYADRSDWVLEMAVEPEFDPLRSDRRFQELLRRVGPAPAPKQPSPQTGVRATLPLTPVRQESPKKAASSQHRDWLASSRIRSPCLSPSWRPLGCSAPA